MAAHQHHGAERVFRGKKLEANADMNMTPMIDVVFQLLIFFMIGSQMSEASKESIPLPKQKGEDQKTALITININNQEEIIMQGNRISMGALIGQVADEVARQDDDPRRVRIVIRADERVRSGAVSAVTEALTRLGVNRVNIAVQAPTP